MRCPQEVTLFGGKHRRHWDRHLSVASLNTCFLSLSFFLEEGRSGEVGANPVGFHLAADQTHGFGSEPAFVLHTVS